MDQSDSQDRSRILKLFDNLSTQMSEGDLQLIFDRGSASLFWKTDAGGGSELSLKFDEASPHEMRAEDVSRIAHFLRDGDLGKPRQSDGSTPGDLAGIIRATMRAVEAMGTPELWCRGQPSLSMKLQPHVFRDTESTERESSLLVRFIAGARSRHANCPEDDDQVSWLALMQHYGLPTRLLDWTESVLIATYFATIADERFDSEPGVIWLLHPGKLNEAFGLPGQICYLRAGEVRQVVNRAFIRGAQYIDRIIAVSAPELDLGFYYSLDVSHCMDTHSHWNLILRRTIFFGKLQFHSSLNHYCMHN